MAETPVAPTVASITPRVAQAIVMALGAATHISLGHVKEAIDGLACAAMLIHQVTDGTPDAEAYVRFMEAMTLASALPGVEQVVADQRADPKFAALYASFKR